MKDLHVTTLDGREEIVPKVDQLMIEQDVLTVLVHGKIVVQYNVRALLKWKLV